MSKAKRLREYFSNNQKGSYDGDYFRKAANYAGTSLLYAKSIFYEKQEIPKEHHEVIASDLIERKYKSLLKDREEKYKVLLERYENIETQFNDLLAIRELKPVKPITRPLEHGGRHEGVAIVQYSDWHVEEKVTKAQTNGLNECNPDIIKKRVDTLALNTLKLINKERQSIDIKDLVIHLGGDFISNWIHDELQQTNYLTPIDATIYATDLLTSAINFLLSNGKFRRVICLCNRGNHGRTTKKMQFANESGTSYETMLYSNLVRQFNDIEFIIPESGIGYYNIYDKTIRFYHGQQVKYKDGVGGISIPLNKIQSKWDKTNKADYNLMCHYHCYSHPNSYTTLNGSLVGYNSFAANFGFPYEPPQQSFTILSYKYGFTIKAPIICI